MSRLDHLHDLVQARGEATDQVTSDIGDVHRRVRVNRRRHIALAGTITSIVVVSTVALVATAIGVLGGSRDERVLSSAAPTTDPSAATWQPAPTSRTLPGGVVLTTTMSPSPIVFGPYGPGDRWTQPADCPAPVDVAMTSSSGTRHDAHITGLTRTAGIKMALAVSREPSQSGTSATLPLGAMVVVLHPVPGATYRLLDGTETLDQASTGGDMLSLYGQIDSGLPLSTTEVPATAGDAVHVQQVSGDDVIADRKPTRPVTTPSPRHCSPPRSPAGLAPAISTSSPTGQEITSVISSLTPADAVPVDGLANVDDSTGQLHTLLNGNRSTVISLTAAAEEIHLVSPDAGWVRYGLRPAGGGTAATTADAFSEWAKLTMTDGKWKVTTPSFCALTSVFKTVCPGQPTYTAIPKAGQQIQVDPGG